MKTKIILLALLALSGCSAYLKAVDFLREQGFTQIKIGESIKCEKDGETGYGLVFDGVKKDGPVYSGSVCCMGMFQNCRLVGVVKLNEAQN